VPLLSSYLMRRRLAAAVPHVGKRVLDLGCGSAWLADRLESLEEYAGVELREERVRELSARHPNWRFLSCDIEREPLPFPERGFDTVVIAAVIEHLAEPGLLLRECCRVLLPRGRLVITTPSPLGHRVHAVASYVGLTARSAVAHHQRKYSRKALDTVLRSASFELVTYRRFLMGLNQLFVYQRPHSAARHDAR